MTAAAAPIAMDRPPKSDAPLLFCPFCRECYEGETKCPEHELALVPFGKLPREEDPEAAPAHDQPLGAFDPRFGRGFVMAGVLALLVGFAMPFLSVESGTQLRVFSGFEAAATRAPNLWTVPFVAGMFVWILARRRTPLAMLGARLVAIVFAFAPIASLAYTIVKVREGAAQLAERGQSMAIGIEHGAWVIAAAAALLLVGAMRFGVLPRNDAETSRRLRE
jgi:hypothetical protein